MKFAFTDKAVQRKLGRGVIKKGEMRSVRCGLATRTNRAEQCLLNFQKKNTEEEQKMTYRGCHKGESRGMWCPAHCGLTYT